MKLSGDMTVKLVLGALVLGGLVYVAYKVKGGILGLTALIPAPVKNGAEAAGQLAKLGGNMVAAPLATFGIVPADNSGWVPTLPWENSPAPADIGQGKLSTTDPISNNDSGVNYNYF